MVSNDNSTENLKIGHITNYEDLETQVIEAIKKKSTSDLFKDKTPNECIYMQKVAEFNLSRDGIILTLSTFFSAIGVTYIFTFFPLQMWLFVGIGCFLLFIGALLYLFGHKLRGKFENYRYIIFEAEKKILEGSGETISQQKNNITSNTKKNPISIEYIKAQLNLLRMKMTGFFGGRLVLVLFFLFLFTFTFLLIPVLIKGDYESILTIAEFVIIGSGTLAILTFTYALCKENRKEDNTIVNSGELFFKSTITFIIGMGILLGSRYMLNNHDIIIKYYPSPVAEVVEASSALVNPIVVIVGIFLFVFSVIYFWLGILKLMKVLTNVR